MAKFIARITVLFDTTVSVDETEAHEIIRDFMAERPGIVSWDYVSIDGERTQPMLVPDPSLDELFDAAWENE